MLQVLISMWPLLSVINLGEDTERVLDSADFTHGQGRDESSKGLFETAQISVLYPDRTKILDDEEGHICVFRLFFFFFLNKGD